MTCAACSNRIEKVLSKQQGVTQATVNLANETAVIEYQPSLVGEDKFIGLIEKLGYHAQPKANKEEKQSNKEKQIQRMKTKLIISAILSIPLDAHKVRGSCLKATQVA